MGVVNVMSDTDGVARKIPLKLQTAEKEQLHSFAFMIASVSGRLNDQQPSHSQSMFRIPYIGKPQSFTQYSYTDVLNGIVPASTFKDKIVVVGATANDLHDSHVTPVSNGIEMSGIEIHANVIQALIDGTSLVVETRTSSTITLMAISIASSIIFILLGVIPMTFALGIFLLAYGAYAFFSFDAGIIRLLVYPPLAIFCGYLINVLYKYFFEQRQRRFLRKAFSYYLSTSVLEEILRDPNKLKLGGDRRELSVLFSDIAGFTTISEKLDPETLTKLLNLYLTKMTDIVFANNGVLDKYAGDAVMAFWGAPINQPDHAISACKTALAMQHAILAMQPEWRQYGAGDLCVRIGINTGEMVVGNMGSNTRFDYTLIGDNVNLGSRLESINKVYGTNIIISGSTYEQVKEQFVTRRLDSVAVKGKASGIVIYELRGAGNADKKTLRLLWSFETALKKYQSGDFKDAIRMFEKILTEFPTDDPTKMYINRCQILITQPPTHWDGIFRAQAK